MTVTELREALEKLEAEGHGAALVVERSGGMVGVGPTAAWTEFLCELNYVGPVRHFNMYPREDGTQFAVELV